MSSSPNPQPSRRPGLRGRADHVAGPNSALGEAISVFAGPQSVRCEAEGGAPGRTRAGGGEPGGQRAAEEAGPRPYDRTGRGPTAARAACGHCHASLVRRSHMLLRGCRERAPEASRRYLPPGARTRVTANLTSSHSRLHVRSAHCPLTFIIEATSSLTPPPRLQMGSPISGDWREDLAGHVTLRVWSAGGGRCAGPGAGKGFPRP